MKMIALLLTSGVLATAAAAQTTAPAGTTANPAVTAPDTHPAADPGATSSGVRVIDMKKDPDQAAGDSNQAVATTNANAPQPAKGANSFTEGEARRRIEKEGYASVADLKKDGDGIWRGHGTKSGSSVGVWLDYKGNIGLQ